MNSYRLTVSSPDGDVYSGNVISLSLRGASGDLAVLPGHIPLVTAVMPGDFVITDNEGNEISGTTNGGILTVSKESVTLASGTAELK